MNAKLEAAMQKLKSAISEVESCMHDSEPQEEAQEMPKLAEIDLAGDQKPEEDESQVNKKKMMLAMMKKKGY